MPKDRRANYLSAHQARVSPYACSSKSHGQGTPRSSSPPVGDEKDWEESRCPICMEHPHNAVLLMCSSRAKGCRPYICDTSHRHSNCLDQFRKSTVESATDAPPEGVSRAAGSATHEQPQDFPMSRGAWHRGRETTHVYPRSRESARPLPELLCPLCRGNVSGWVVIEPARRYMNSKPRSCSLETCSYSGNYSQLRKHVRREHPSVRPSEADPRRQSEWTRMVQQRDIEDTLSAYRRYSDDLDTDDLLDDFQLDDSIFDILGGVLSEDEDEWSLMGFSFSEPEEELNLTGDMLTDFEFELDYTFLHDMFSYPRFEAMDSGGRFQGQRSTPQRSRSRYNYSRHNTPTTPPPPPPRRRNTRSPSRAARNTRNRNTSLRHYYHDGSW